MQQMKTGVERRDGEFSNLGTCMGSHTCHQDEDRKKKKSGFPYGGLGSLGDFIVELINTQFEKQREFLWSVESSWSLD